jgi:HlyD family secretion protein
MIGRMIKIVAIVLAVAIAAGAAAWWYRARAADTGQYRTAQVQRADIVSVIPATGTVVPEDVIDVGAQVNGQIASFGKDSDGKTIDYRSTVQEGTVLARIDDALYAADLATSQAQLEQAKAQVQFADASRDQAKAKLEQTTRDWERAQKLGQSAALAQADYDAARSAYEQAVAGLAVADASIGQAKAAVDIASAAVQRNQRNLAYCTITAPVSGVVIDKRVEIGQTVVASLNAPSLFLLAKDLRRMDVLVQVNEADIGNVHPQQVVNFTVDAFPFQTFRGDVRKVRLNASMTQNVVTYTVEITTDNSDLKLLPYLTANVRFVVAEHDDVLAVPNAALRWSPASTAATQPVGMGQRGGRGGGSASASQPATTRPRQGSIGTVWILSDGQPKPVRVRTGLTDGVFTEFESTELPEGAIVIIGDESPTRAVQAPGTNASPFTPQFPRGGGRGPR